jgi:Cu/Ag efflux protein CusF
MHERVTLRIRPVKIALLAFTLVLCLACTGGPKPAPAKHYQLTGKVVSLNAKEQTAAIDAAAIPNFMDAMTMDYPIASKAEFASLRVGDRITATVNMNDDGSYGLSQIKRQAAAPR